MFVIDDVGWNDVGYHPGGKNITATPYLDSMARDGIMLNRYYVQPVCSATRAAFMQGERMNVVMAKGSVCRGDSHLQDAILSAPACSTSARLHQPARPRCLWNKTQWPNSLSKQGMRNAQSD